MIQQDRCAMKVTTDACLFGAWISQKNQDLNIKNVLDIGTGTGLLSMMLAQKNSQVTIDAIEIDETCFQQARENSTASPFSARINPLYGDAKHFSFPVKYDLIISNPPFYEKEIKSDTHQKNLAHHNEGLLLTELLSLIKKTLNEGGQFYLLLPYKRNNEVKQLLRKHDMQVTHIVFVRQSVAHDYFRMMLCGQLAPGNKEILLDEISIKDNNEQYTPEFIELLKDYYLHL
jgi:tRNA1Val (adenine37-N6)-methyltransferase